MAAVGQIRKKKTKYKPALEIPKPKKADHRNFTRIKSLGYGILALHVYGSYYIIIFVFLVVVLQRMNDIVAV